MKQKHKPGLRAGLLVGLLLAPPLMALLYLADRVLGLPFLPFDLFDWMARILPGAVISFGINLMVTIIATFNLGETSSTAKAAEQLMGLGLFLALTTAAAAIFFALLGRFWQRAQVPWMAGAALGLALALPLLLISQSVNVTATADPLLGLGWVLLALVLWGLTAAWLYHRLDRAPAPAAADPPAAEESAPAVEVSAPPAAAYVLDRRQFLIRVGGAAATITVFGAGLGSLLGRDEAVLPTLVSSIDGDDFASGLPNAGDPLIPAPGTRPEYTPLDRHYRIDISLRPPVIEEESWVLPFTGLVENPLEFTLSQLREEFEAVERYITISCISNRVGGDLISTTKWTGARMQEVLARVRPTSAARALKITAGDGFDEYLSLDMIANDDRIMLAYAWDDQPLLTRHGFPLRVYIPDLYGMKQPKWITGIEAVPSHEPGYWVRRGWSPTANVKPTSVVDTVATDHVYEEDGQFYVPVGGIAHSGAKGISRVEVSVDDGPWEEARLRTPLSDTTWVIWRYDWPFAEGSHRFSVRCYDGSGQLQETEEGVQRPNGYKDAQVGIHSRTANLLPLETES